MIFAFIILGFLFAPMTGVQAQSRFEISLGSSVDTYTVSEEDYIVVRLGWLACNKGFVNNYKEKTYGTLNLDDKTLVWADTYSKYFTDTVPFDGTIEIECLVPPHNKNLSRTDWRYSLRTLTPGTHTVQLLSRFSPRYTDGFDLDRDGSQDVYVGLNIDKTIKIIVE